MMPNPHGQVRLRFLAFWRTCLLCASSFIKHSSCTSFCLSSASPCCRWSLRRPCVGRRDRALRFLTPCCGRHCLCQICNLMTSLPILPPRVLFLRPRDPSSFTDYFRVNRAADEKSIYVDAETRIQILETMLMLPQADKEQCAAFIVRFILPH